MAGFQAWAFRRQGIEVRDVYQVEGLGFRAENSGFRA